MVVAKSHLQNLFQGRLNVKNLNYSAVTHLAGAIFFFQTCCFDQIWEAAWSVMSLHQACTHGLYGTDVLNDLMTAINAPVKTEIEGADFPTFPLLFQCSYIVELRDVLQEQSLRVISLISCLHYKIAVHLVGLLGQRCCYGVRFQSTQNKENHKYLTYTVCLNIFLQGTHIGEKQPWCSQFVHVSSKPYVDIGSWWISVW